MSFLAITGLINLATSITIGFFVLAKKPSSPHNRSFFYVNASIALFSSGYFFWQLSGDSNSAEFYFLLLTVGIIFINITVLHLVFIFVGIYRQKKKELIFLYLLNFIFIIFAINSNLFSSLEARYGLGFWPIPLPLFHVYLVFWLWEAGYAFLWLYRGLKKSTGSDREQIKYTILSALIAFLGGGSNWLMWYGINFPPYMNILISVYIFIAAYAIIKYRFMDIRIALSRTGIFLSVYTFVLGIPFMIGFRTDYNFASIVSLFLLATSGPVIYRYLKDKADDILLAKQRQYQNIILESAKKTVRENNLDTVLKILISGIEEAIEMEFSGIFLEDRENKNYCLRGEGNSNSDFKISDIPFDHPLINYLKFKKSPLTHEQLITIINRNDSIKLNGINESQIHLIVPIIPGNNLIGFIVLGEKKDKSYYSIDDISTFEIVSHQAALAIENSIFLEKNKSAQERLFQAEKLAFIGSMAEGLAHQIKNRLNCFSFAAAEIQLEKNYFLKKRHKSETPDQQEIQNFMKNLDNISATLIEDVKKTDSIIKGVLEYSNAYRNDNIFSEIFFDEIIEGAINLSHIKYDTELYPVKIEIEASNIIYGVMTQLLEAICNILNNSYDAISEKINSLQNESEKNSFSPEIKIYLTHSEKTFMIKIYDNGIGIRNEDLKKMFTPYFTTKSSSRKISSTGISLFTVKRIVEENHHGKIWFESEFMKGTTIHFELPHQESSAKKLSLGKKVI